MNINNSKCMRFISSFICVAFLTCSCQTYHEWKYDLLTSKADVMVEYNGFEDFRVFGRKVPTIHAATFKDYIDANFPNRDIAWVVVGKHAQEHCWNEKEHENIVNRLLELGFKRVICKRALSSSAYWIISDSSNPGMRETNGVRRRMGE